uniref:Uncharacterized protein n=1 Tax=Bursaphelenchus xylophilus TaxID=6326 RepID=A0A1I7S9K5_BURXY
MEQLLHCNILANLHLPSNITHHVQDFFIINFTPPSCHFDIRWTESKSAVGCGLRRFLNFRDMGVALGRWFGLGQLVDQSLREFRQFRQLHGPLQQCSRNFVECFQLYAHLSSNSNWLTCISATDQLPNCSWIICKALLFNYFSPVSIAAL